jgi:hypothetical protein
LTQLELSLRSKKLRRDEPRDNSILNLKETNFQIR